MNTIPTAIKADHIVLALADIDKKGVPDKRRSTKFSIFFDGKYYPPKYVLTLASKFATGMELHPSLFSGGDQSNKFLKSLDFEIVENEIKTNKESWIDPNGFLLGHNYSRRDVADIGGVHRPKQDRNWVGVVEFKNFVVFFVTLDKRSLPDDYEYLDYFDEETFWWESQTRHREDSPVIEKIIEEDLEPLLFVRITEKTKSKTNPFVYCGRLQYLAHASTKPVQFEFWSKDYNSEAKGDLHSIYEWRPNSQNLSREIDKATELDPKRGQGRISDAKRRKEIELRGMKLATLHYESLGYEVEDTSHKYPYDLECTNSAEKFNVEVKATVGSGTNVTVTTNEVAHARDPDLRTVLFIVYDIEVSDQIGAIRASGGQKRIIENWYPEEENLTALTYRYNLP